MSACSGVFHLINLNDVARKNTWVVCEPKSEGGETGMIRTGVETRSRDGRDRWAASRAVCTRMQI